MTPVMKRAEARFARSSRRAKVSVMFRLSASPGTRPVSGLDQPTRRLVTTGEHPVELAADQPTPEPVPDRPERGPVLDLVPQDRAARAVVEDPMAVIPPGE